MTGSSSMICRHVEALHAYVPGEQPKTPGLIKLNTNENPYPPSPRVLEVLRGLGEGALRLYPDPMCTALRERIAALHGVSPEQVFVGNGSDEVLALCTRAFVEDGGAIGYFEPSYSLYPVLSDIRPAQRRPVPLGEDFSWRMPEDDHASLFYLTQPNAPTSLAFPRERIEAFARAFRGVLLIDEAYADFAPETFMDLAATFDHVLVSRSLSKSYSLAGARAGYAVGPSRLIAALHKIKDSYNVNAITQAIALAALDDQAAMRANVARIIATRERIAGALTRRGYVVHPSATNFLWVRPPAGQPAAGVFARLRERNILIRYFPGPATGDHLRITIGTDEQMDAFLAALDHDEPPRAAR
ncbi:MAG TPA: histidinol-phosphate transaminase [Kiritimatiellia bacterium]|nr:histidinol-phosphate transaminase [Kiritimatiellia bacterium]